MQEAIQSELQRIEKQERSCRKAALTLGPFEKLETEVSTISAFAFTGATQVFVSVAPKRPDEALALVQEILRITGIKKAEKRFNEYSGTVEFSIKANGLKIEVKSCPPRCEVEEYEAEEYTPARRETIRKFRLKNPEECLGKKAE